MTSKNESFPAACGQALRDYWQPMPNKALFCALLAVWLAFFHWLGNSTLGYVKTTSLFGWMHYVFTTSADDAHGRLIPFVVLALLWWKRRELLAAPKGIWWPALALVAPGLLIHLIGFTVQQTRISIIGFFIGLYGLTGLVWGRQWLQRTFFPFFLFAFCVPLGTMSDSLTFPLRMLVSKTSVGIGHVLGIDVIREGSQIFNPRGTFQYDVAPACSGIRSLTALLALTTIYGFVNFRATWKRLLMVGLAIPLAVVGNVARITGVIIAGETFGQAAGEKFHDGAGFLTFAVAITCVLGLSHWLREERKETKGKEIPVPPASLWPQQPWVALGVTVLLVGTSGSLLWRLQATQQLGVPGLMVTQKPIYDPDGKVVGTNIVDLPAAVAGFESEALPVAPIELDWLPKDTTFGRRAYKAQDGFATTLSAVLMGCDRGSIHKPQICLVGQGWTIARSETDTVLVERPYPYRLPVMKLLTSKQLKNIRGEPITAHGLYVYWFVSKDQLTALHGERMWWMARDLIQKGILQRWAYVSCFSICLPGKEQATYERMKRFIGAVVPTFQFTAGARIKEQPAVVSSVN